MILLDYKLTLLQVVLIGVNCLFAVMNYYSGKAFWWFSLIAAGFLILLGIILFILETKIIESKKRIAEYDRKIFRLIEEIKTGYRKSEVDEQSEDT